MQNVLGGGEWGGGGVRVNKVLYGLCENGEWLSCVQLHLVSQTFAN